MSFDDLQKKFIDRTLFWYLVLHGSILITTTILIIVTIILISKILIKIRNGVQHQPLTSIPLPRHPAQPSTCYRSPVSGALHGDDNDDAGGDDDENGDW